MVFVYYTLLLPTAAFVTLTFVLFRRVLETRTDALPPLVLPLTSIGLSSRPSPRTVDGLCEF